MTTQSTRSGWRAWLRAGAISLIAMVALSLLSAPLSAAQGALDAPDVSAGSVFAFDPATGEVIIEHNANERRLIGSVVKIATALVVVDQLDPDQEIVIAGSDMVEPGFSAMGLQPGDTLTVRQLLTGLLVVSGGDAAQALAREAGGQLGGGGDPAVAIAAFVDAMNAKVADLDLADTQFANPDGDDSDESWSTAHDVAMLYAELAADPLLAELAALPDYAFSSVGPEATPYAGTSTNQLIGQYGVLSAKTGSTESAGGCLVLDRAMANGEGTEIVAILGADLAYDETWTPIVDERWNDAIAVMEAIDAGWTPAQNPAADVATEAPVAAAATGGASNERQPRPAPVVESGSFPEARAAAPLLAATAAGGVLAVAGFVTWSRDPHRAGSNRGVVRLQRS